MSYTPIICVDFDGVIHSYHRGWQGGEIYGWVTRGFFEWLGEMQQQGCEVHIYSSRSKTPEGIQAMQAWLARQEQEWKILKGKDHKPTHSLKDIVFSAQKPAAHITVDDRCVRFEGSWTDPEIDPDYILRFKPWTQVRGATFSAPTPTPEAATESATEPASTPTPKTHGFKSDADFLLYCEVHARTERGAFSSRHIAELLRLADLEEDARAWDGVGNIIVDGWKNDVDELVARAREILREREAKLIAEDAGTRSYDEYLEAIQPGIDISPSHMRRQYIMLALSGEVGEAANLVKKEWRGDNISPEVIKDRLKSETADILAYTFQLCKHEGWDPLTIMWEKHLEVEARQQFKDLKAIPTEVREHNELKRIMASKV